jgi:hypothetical protein
MHVSLSFHSVDYPATDHDCRDVWQVWKNTEGQTSLIREHLNTKHHTIYCETIAIKRLKGWETIDVVPEGHKHDKEIFSLDGFYERLI